MILKLPAVTISAFGRKVGRRLDPKGGGFSAEMAVAFGAGVASPQGGCWGQLDPGGILQLEGEANFPCLGAHEAHPKTTLSGVVFQKLNGPLLTSAPQSPPGSKAALR